MGEAALAAELWTAGAFGRAGREPSLAAARRYFSSFPALIAGSEVTFASGGI